MNHAPPLLPAMTLHVQLDGLARLGLDAAAIRAHLGPLPDAPQTQVPASTYHALWQHGQAAFARPGLPTALALAIPFGAFGALDYLVASAETLGGALLSAQLYFAMVASDVRVSLEDAGEGSRRVRVQAIEHATAPGLEFTLACIHGRLQHLSGHAYRPQHVWLQDAAHEPESVRRAVYGQALLMGAPHTQLQLSARDWARPCQGADAYLHLALRQMADAYPTPPPATDSLETALRVRLRGAIEQHDASPARLAQLLGISERTLQRRLAERGRRYEAIVDDVRHEEALRLLRDPALSLVRVAAKLGYAEQTSFTRAFRRWTATTPNRWRRAQA